VPAEDEPRLAALPGVLDTRREGRRSVLLAADADSVVRALVHADVPFRDLEVRGASLEEAFLALTAATPEDPR
jgi:ABC-2 type transport system ATP-binding protein